MKRIIIALLATLTTLMVVMSPTFAQGPKLRVIEVKMATYLQG